MRDLASVELHFTKHSSVIAEKTSRTGGLRCTVSLYIKIQECQMHPAEDGLRLRRPLMNTS
jgi:hypothetical protein